jgi:hypothetical protein
MKAFPERALNLAFNASLIVNKPIFAGESQSELWRMWWANVNLTIAVQRPAFSEGSMALYPNVSHFFDSFDCHVSVNSNN